MFVGEKRMSSYWKVWSAVLLFAVIVFITANILGLQYTQHTLTSNNGHFYRQKKPTTRSLPLQDDIEIRNSNYNGTIIQDHGKQWNISLAVRSSRGRTSPLKTKITLAQDENGVYRGDFITFKISARDVYDRLRVFGGDLWYATMYDQKSKFGTMGKVVDHNDGTYSAHFYAGNAGTVAFRFVLVLQREAITFQRNFLRTTEMRAAWTGTFISGNVTEKSNCFLVREGTWKDKCEFPHPKALGKSTFLCDPPKSLPCNTMSLITVNGKSGATVTMNTETKSLFQSWNANQKVTSSPTRLNIKERGTSAVRDTDIYTIPSCEADLKAPLSDGYWLKDRWVSLVCQNRKWNDVIEVQQCLQNKEIYFLGDSTTRQWFQMMVEVVGYPINVTDRNWRPRVKSIPDEYLVTGEDDYHWNIQDLRNNITMKYRHHALSRHSQIPIHRFPYVVDVLDDLKAPQCNYIILISLWAHFNTWTLDSFHERLINIQKGLVRLRERCPNLMVAVKGPHDRGDVRGYWILYDMIRILKEVFVGHKVFFIDIWDMNFAYAFAQKKRIQIHMPMELIREEVFMFLSHVCEQRSTKLE
ncbi:NXPE family member 4-like [Ptychodera flava]|uniref:NXPE family member 4-like n=1 Tax=Ptychodera flava TaxID=63121 RepID=UPI003969DEBE